MIIMPVRLSDNYDREAETQNIGSDWPLTGKFGADAGQRLKMAPPALQPA